MASASWFILKRKAVQENTVIKKKNASREKSHSDSFLHFRTLPELFFKNSLFQNFCMSAPSYILSLPSNCDNGFQSLWEGLFVFNGQKHYQHAAKWP